MTPARRVSLADFSRRYLDVGIVACGEKPTSVGVQPSDDSRDGLAEHVFLAMAKPADELTRPYLRTVPLGGR
jgi:hypothetical protein